MPMDTLPGLFFRGGPMPEYIVTLKSEKQGGGFWPFLRGCFAWIGFGVVVLAVLSLQTGQYPDPKRAIEAFREGVQAYRKANENPYAGIAFDPSPAPEAERVCNPYDDHHNAEACALRGGDPPPDTATPVEPNNPQ